MRLQYHEFIFAGVTKNRPTGPSQKQITVIFRGNRGEDDTGGDLYSHNQLSVSLQAAFDAIGVRKPQNVLPIALQPVNVIPRSGAGWLRKSGGKGQVFRDRFADLAGKNCMVRVHISGRDGDIVQACLFCSSPVSIHPKKSPGPVTSKPSQQRPTPYTYPSNRFPSVPSIHHRFRLTENRRTITSRMVYFVSASAMPPRRIHSSNTGGGGMST